jgi:hypothetical protein
MIVVQVRTTDSTCAETHQNFSVRWPWLGPLLDFQGFGGMDDTRFRS